MSKNTLNINYYRCLESLVGLTLYVLLSLPVQAGPQVIYGPDSRYEFQDITSSLIKHQGRAVASIIDRYSLQKEGSRFKILTSIFGESHRLCKHERFYDQATLGHCTAFLVSEDHVLTAGHCIESEWACRHSAFVFDFTDGTTSEDSYYRTDSENVYYCKNIVRSKQNPNFELDFAIIQLSRKVKDRSPLPLRRSGRIPLNAELYMLGHPYGLSLKYINDAHILKNDYNAIFTATLDSMVGASGSPVINQETGLVEGMLINGEKDFRLTNTGCYESIVCDMKRSSNCTGETIQRISEVIPYIP